MYILNSIEISQYAIHYYIIRKSLTKNAHQTNVLNHSSGLDIRVPSKRLTSPMNASRGVTQTLVSRIKSKKGWCRSLKIVGASLIGSYLIFQFLLEFKNWEEVKAKYPESTL